MRRKAELQIRKAAAAHGAASVHPVDKVRAGTALVRKVFDKTLLDMARVGTIELFSKDISELTPAEIQDCVRQGDALYVSFSFLEEDPVAAMEPDAVDVVIREMNREVWDRFRFYCRRREDKDPLDKLREMIEDYNRRSGTL